MESVKKSEDYGRQAIAGKGTREVSLSDLTRSWFELIEPVGGLNREL